MCGRGAGCILEMGRATDRKQTRIMQETAAAWTDEVVFARSPHGTTWAETTWTHTLQSPPLLLLLPHPDSGGEAAKKFALSIRFCLIFANEPSVWSYPLTFFVRSEFSNQQSHTASALRYCHFSMPLVKVVRGRFLGCRVCLDVWGITLTSSLHIQETLCSMASRRVGLLASGPRPYML